MNHDQEMEPASGHEVIRMLVRVRDDYQQMRKRVDNRLGRKANGKDQNVKGRFLLPQDYALLSDVANNAHEMEGTLEKELLERLRTIPVYIAFLSQVKGIGPIAAGWIVGEFDIHKATTVSKLWQFAGLNPGLVEGQEIIKGPDGKPELDERGHIKLRRTGKMIRGDKLTPGFVAPFNQRLRTALVGVMADGFIKCQNKYTEHYYQYKQRLEHEDNKVTGEEKVWSEVSKARRDRAAKRYMVKMFLMDLYVEWRTIEKLPIRPPYQEEYLGHQHSVVDNSGA